MSRRCVVTGGAGFIGSHIVDALLAAGDEVTVLDDLSSGRLENLAGSEARLLRVDVANGDALAAAFEAARPEVVFHLAAQIDVRRSVAEPARDALVNVCGTLNVLEAARAGGARRVVLSSTGGAIYGDAERLPTPEDASARPLSPYGQAKLAAEGYCALYARLHGLSTIALRYANVYGPRQDPLGEGGVVAIFCEARRSGGATRIYGDGLQTRDFVHVADIARANLLAADSDRGEPLNIGTGAETSVRELAAQLGLSPERAPARAGEVRRSCLDPGRARQTLGWRAEIALADGLESTLAG